MTGIAPDKQTPLGVATRELRAPLTAMIFVGVFVNLALLVPPLYMLQVYDRVLSSGNITTLLMLSIIAVVMLAVYGILEFCRNGILVRASRQFDETVSEPLFKLLSVRVERDTQSVGEQALRDVATLRDTLGSNTPASLSDVPWTPFFIALCFIMHPALGLVALAATILIFSVALLTDRLTRDGVKKSTTCAAKAGRTASSVFQNADSLRGLGMTPAMHGRWVDSHTGTLEAYAQTGERTAMMLALSKFVRMTVQSAILGTGAYLAVKGQISPGVMIAASIVMGRALAPVEQIVGNWKRILAARAAYKRLDALFKILPADEGRTDLPKPTGRLTLENTTIVPPGANMPCVRNVNVKLNSGEVLGIVGRSGSGKSSLARAIAGVWPVAAGAIRLDGASLDQWAPESLGAHVGYVGQNVVLFDGTVAENIARLMNAPSRDVINAAVLAGVHEAILRLPNGYDTVIGEKGMMLSGGMSQRVALARAVFGNPRLIVLDEPNANLDSEGDAALARAIQALKGNGATVIAVTHKPQLLSQVDKVLVMNEGRSQAFGPRDKVLRPTGTKPAGEAGGDKSTQHSAAA
jgi:ATP-binding cassette, subfamily C, type I secretion system permease/ATPase